VYWAGGEGRTTAGNTYGLAETGWVVENNSHVLLYRGGQRQRTFTSDIKISFSSNVLSHQASSDISILKQCTFSHISLKFKQKGRSGKAA
jgi:hypothetical protein